MKWLVAFLALLLILLVVRRSQKKPKTALRTGDGPRLGPDDRRLSSLKSLEGSICIYEEGDYILVGRLVQLQQSSLGPVFAVQILRAEGLSDSPDDRLHLETSWSQLAYAHQIVHARQMHWRLYFNRELVEKVQELGRARTDHKDIKRVLLEHQMK